MSQRPRYTGGIFYHVYNRGVEKRDIFMDDKDRFRFIHNLYELNDARSVTNSTFYHNYRGSTSIVEERRTRELLVDLLAFVLMPNHYHLVIHQRYDGGIPSFMRKLANGYTGYFNIKYERSGVLFQGRYKVKPVVDNSYLNYLISYIHLNPLELFSPGWKEGNAKNTEYALRQLRAYRWSSYADYVGDKNFPSVLNTKLIKSLGLPFGKTGDHQKDIFDLATDRNRYDQFAKVEF